ncbi:glutamate--cysteine ligase [Natronomonas pharaonis DSM 2160]|uniref:Glutamate--cysteine ligase n=1 Tax=Natronomonas pharaonis (strain ATCC 35678 / DSM 2160 / CIP 103997 / JCM 8858 / NBRC 14720 / NCIMB 2260 / Gabara) TaxID=348780 RepID=GCS2_NATPD|nr:glutamate--cysteine ligase [Natronomonas pharaonis]Q3IQ21.1 RecName: Full=Glutamate--cysteine ligase; AltName: Full=Gamma-glutamylcysteine synthetase; Short=GCS; Short=Gamma-GCS [Natronomonas pharaonis DSM 2160]CAI49777.1 glutamate--cysteine ligase [Natronomonas pharaonis DSM 2160]
MDLGSREAFDRTGTLGIEEEFFVVDEYGRPTAGTDELVYENEPPEPLKDRLDHELFKCVIETQTPTIGSLSAADDALAEVRKALVSHAETHGFGIAAAGLHPAAKWRELDHAEKPRYRAQLDRIQYPQHRNTTAGLHIHVGVDDADKAVWVANELRWYMPVMLALSANSPYWNGFDTGLQSARAKIFEALPNTGMPTAFEDFESFQSFERTMVETGSINDRGELWYDVRPHSEHGTVEVRTPDGQADPDHVLAFVEYTQALVEDLSARYEDGESGANHRRELLDENKWRALRHGHDAELLDRSLEESVPLGELVESECQRLGVSGIRDVYEAESGAEKQRRLLESEGMDALCGSLSVEWDSS